MFGVRGDRRGEANLRTLPAFANADAGANAYTHVAIDEAWRAVNELTG